MNKVLFRVEVAIKVSGEGKKKIRGNTHFRQGEFTVNGLDESGVEMVSSYPTDVSIACIPSKVRSKNLVSCKHTRAERIPEAFRFVKVSMSFQSKGHYTSKKPIGKHFPCKLLKSYFKK